LVHLDSISEREAREGVPLLSDPPLLADSFVAATDKAKSEGRKRTAEDVAEAVDERKPDLKPVPDDPPKGWADDDRARRAEAYRIKAEKKAIDERRAAFRKQIDKARPLLGLDVSEVAALLRDTDTRPLRSTLRDLATWATDLAHLLDEPLGGI
jgi:NTP pyrophosphatase (non-canonical NTP hydrolase)